MKIEQFGCAFAGLRESKIPYAVTSKEHERLEKVLNDEIVEVVRDGAVNFYFSAQNGIDNLSALLTLNIRNEIGGTMYLHLVLPYRTISSGFSLLQKDNYDTVYTNCDTVTCLNEDYHRNCFRECNQYRVDHSQYMIAVWDGNARSGTSMSINMAKKKGMDIRIINPLTYEVERIQAKMPLEKLINK